MPPKKKEKPAPEPPITDYRHAEKERREGKGAVTEGERRKWVLPNLTPRPPSLKGKGEQERTRENEAGEMSAGWRHWEAPYEVDPEWPEGLRQALEGYREAWRGKMDEVNALIPASPIVGEVEALGTCADQPETGFPPHPGPLPEGEGAGGEPQNAAAYLEKMIPLATGADKVAAWLLDSDYDDYDGATFCVSQAFFPDRTAWEKLARALKGVVYPERFEAFSGTRSLPFAAGAHRRIAVKVIDPRGNEVMRVISLTKVGLQEQY
jgi:hypothetical protein